MKESFKAAQTRSYQPHFEQGIDNSRTKTQFLPQEFSSSNGKKSATAVDNLKIEPLHPRLKLTQAQAWKNYLEKLESLDL